MTGTWTSFEEIALTRESLAAVLDNRIPAVRIRGFATADECAAFARATRAGKLKYYSIQPPVAYIGMAQYEYRWNRPKSDYFRDVVEANSNLASVTADSFDPIARLIARIQAVHDAPVGIAIEPGFGPYYAGIARIASQGISLHSDYAPFNSPDYAISAIDAQLGWNFFAEQPVSGGMTTVHNRPWTPAVRPGEIPQSYGLPRDTVAGAVSYRYAPTVGDVVIFNSRNPHEVEGGPTEPGRDRISIGSFLGRMPDRSLVMWS
jgi:hypothetical protein